MAIYSCTLFFNEFDLLNVKASEELRGGVDKIVVVESARTFQNNKKPLWLSENKQRINYPIEIVTVDKEFDRVSHPHKTIACFKREAIQRNAAVQALDIHDDDIIIAADVDEIFLSDDIKKIVLDVKKYGFVRLVQNQFYYKINLMSISKWHGAFAVAGWFFKAGFTLNRLRTQEGIKSFTEGKHFGYIMTAAQIAKKLKSFSHVDFADDKHTDINILQKVIDERKDLYGRKYNLTPVKIDNTYPKLMLDNLSFWSQFIIPDPEKSIKEVDTEIVMLSFNPYDVKIYDMINQDL